MLSKKTFEIQHIKPYLKIFGHLFVLISFAFLAKIIYNNLTELQNLEFTIANILILILLIIWGIVGYTFFSYTCVIQAQEKYPQFSLYDSFKIVATTQIAKYLPGNVGHHIGRFYLSNKIFSSADTLYFFFIENIFFILASTLLGSFYLTFIDLTKLANNLTYFLLGFVTLVALPIAYKILKRVKTKFNIIHSQKKSLIIIFIIFLFTSTQGGISIYFILKYILSVQTPSLFICLSGFSISFLVGFIMPGAPAGIGVREYSFTLLFSPFIGEIIALKAIVIFRLISTTTDIVLYLVGKTLNQKSLEVKRS